MAYKLMRTNEGPLEGALMSVVSGVGVMKDNWRSTALLEDRTLSYKVCD